MYTAGFFFLDHWEFLISTSIALPGSVLALIRLKQMFKRLKLVQKDRNTHPLVVRSLNRRIGKESMTTKTRAETINIGKQDPMPLIYPSASSRQQDDFLFDEKPSDTYTMPSHARQRSEVLHAARMEAARERKERGLKAQQRQSHAETINFDEQDPLYEEIAQYGARPIVRRASHYLSRCGKDYQEPPRKVTSRKKRHL